MWRADITKKGFTLVELLVALGLFALVMTMAAAATLTILDANAKSESSSSVMTNLNIALDSMTREMRTGTSFSCGGCTRNLAGSYVQFTTQDGVTVKYSIVKDQNNRGSITKEIISPNPQEALAITAPEINVKKLDFYGSGFDTYASNGDTDQPLIRIVISGEAGVKQKLISTFNIQTSVSQRLLDI